MSESTSSLGRSLELLRIIGATNPAGIRIKDLAAAAGCGQSTAHRALQELVLAGFVEQESSGKRYRLALDFLVLAAQAGQANGLRELARPVLLRLSAMLTKRCFCSCDMGSIPFAGPYRGASQLGAIEIGQG